MSFEVCRWKDNRIVCSKIGVCIVSDCMSVGEYDNHRYAPARMHETVAVAG